MAQAHDRLQALFESLYDWGTPECPNLVEINITGGRRFFFTCEPEHVKTILTGLPWRQYLHHRPPIMAKESELNQTYVC
jgi:hypothetical protein